MKQIRMMIIAVLAMLMPTMLFGGGKSSTYYSALKTQMSSKSTGMGKVYAGTSQTAPATSNYQETSSQSSNQSSSTKDAAKTFYAFATENEGYEFVGWSTSENGTTTSSDNPYAVSVKCSSTSSGSPTLTTVYANFKKKVQKVALQVALSVIYLGLKGTGRFSEDELKKIFFSADLTMAEIESGTNSFENIEKELLNRMVKFELAKVNTTGTIPS